MTNKSEEKKMTNKNFWLGILVMALVFGMTVVWVGCSTSSDDVATLKIVNEYSLPITRVVVDGRDKPYLDRDGLNIKPSSSQTFSIDLPADMLSIGTYINLYYGDGRARRYIDFWSGATWNVTLLSDGTTVSVQREW